MEVRLGGALGIGTRKFSPVLRIGKTFDGGLRASANVL
jgi:hypothetical protein